MGSHMNRPNWRGRGHQRPPWSPNTMPQGNCGSSLGVQAPPRKHLWPRHSGSLQNVPQFEGLGQTEMRTPGLGYRRPPPGSPGKQAWLPRPHVLHTLGRRVLTGTCGHGQPGPRGRTARPRPSLAGALSKHTPAPRLQVSHFPCLGVSLEEGCAPFREQRRGLRVSSREAACMGQTALCNTGRAGQPGAAGD